jgi:predicted TIM-barrel fold metal-dependent hydrolase
MRPFITDIHAHHAPAGLSRASDPSKVRVATVYPPFEARLALMETAGVGRQVLSCTAPTYLDDPLEARAKVQLINDELSALCAADPERFWFWASLPLPHVDESLREMERVLDRPGAAGIYLGCSCQGGSIAREEFEPIYAEMERRRGVVFLHPVQNGLNAPLINDLGLTVCAGASIEDSIAALHLVARGVPQRYPSVRFIIPHLGGVLPMLLNRLDGQMPPVPGGEPPSAVLKRLFYDTVGWGSKAGLAAAVEAFGDSQLVPGSDYPFLLAWEEYEQTFQHIREAGLPDSSVQKILFENVERLFSERVSA